MGFQIVKLIGQGLNNTIITGGLVPKGAYSNVTDYAVGDAVSYQGSSYVMHTNAPAGTLPTDTVYWQILAEKGDAGSGTNALVFNETPGGTINNSNTVFTIVNGFVTGSTQVYLNTARQILTYDYTETGADEITFVSAPQIGDILIIDYLKS